MLLAQLPEASQALMDSHVHEAAQEDAEAIKKRRRTTKKLTPDSIHGWSGGGPLV